MAEIPTPDPWAKPMNEWSIGDVEKALEAETTDRWTEGVCGDGAAILYDGVSVSISCVLEALNDRDNLRGVLAEISAARTDTTDDRQKEIEAWSKALARAEDLAIERKKEIQWLQTDRDNLRGVLAEISAARTEADLFWDDADPEIGYQDIADIVDNYCPGEIVRIQRAVRLHDVFVVQIGDETRQFDDDKEAEAWVRSMEEIDDAKKL